MSGYWTRLHEASPFATPWALAQSVVAHYFLTPGQDCSLEITKYQEIKLHVEHSKLDPKVRQSLKRHFDFSIPSWMENYQVKSLEASEGFEIASVSWSLTVTIGGAMVCKAVGTKLQSRPEYCLEEASKLDQMTADEALAYVRSKAANLRTPQEVPIYDCKITEEKADAQA